MCPSFMGRIPAAPIGGVGGRGASVGKGEGLIKDFETRGAI